MLDLYCNCVIIAWLPTLHCQMSILHMTGCTIVPTLYYLFSLGILFHFVEQLSRIENIFFIMTCTWIVKRAEQTSEWQISTVLVKQCISL